MLQEYRFNENGQYEHDKVQIAIERLCMYEPLALELDSEHGYYLCDSGGKDSSVIKELAFMAGVKFAIHHHHTTLDYPDTVYFIRRERERWTKLEIEYDIDYPKESFWQLALKKSCLPMRIARYCCTVLKEGGGENKVAITGVRWAESANRKRLRGIAEVQEKNKGNSLILNNDNADNRRIIETCQLKGKRIVNPIIDWDDEDVWEFLHKYNVPVNPLYAAGFKRVGCMLCPFASKSEKLATLERYPQLKRRMLHLCKAIIDNKIAKGKSMDTTTAEEYLDKWIKG